MKSVFFASFYEELTKNCLESNSRLHECSRVCRTWPASIVGMFAPLKNYEEAISHKVRAELDPALELLYEIGCGVHTRVPWEDMGKFAFDIWSSSEAMSLFGELQPTRYVAKWVKLTDTKCVWQIVIDDEQAELEQMGIPCDDKELMALYMGFCAAVREHCSNPNEYYVSNVDATTLELFCGRLMDIYDLAKSEPVKPVSWNDFGYEIGKSYISNRYLEKMGYLFPEVFDYIITDITSLFPPNKPIFAVNQTSEGIGVVSLNQ